MVIHALNHVTNNFNQYFLSSNSSDAEFDHSFPNALQSGKRRGLQYLFLAFIIFPLPYCTWLFVVYLTMNDGHKYKVEITGKLFTILVYSFIVRYVKLKFLCNFTGNCTSIIFYIKVFINSFT